MDANQIVKNRILANQISQYFQDNPARESVIIKADLGENKVYWRAIREGDNRFRITEVRTNTTSYIFEAKLSSKAAKRLKSLQATTTTKTRKNKKKKNKKKLPFYKV